MKQEKEEKEPRTAPEDGTKKSYEELEHENLLLKFEVEYLKKLKALAERETGGRRKPPKSSSKAKGSETR